MKIPFTNYFIDKRENETKQFKSFTVIEEGCACCHRDMDLRMGYCFDCVEMQSVFIDGTDMYDKKIKTAGNEPESITRLKYIINRASRMGLY